MNPVSEIRDNRERRKTEGTVSISFAAKAGLQNQTLEDAMSARSPFIVVAFAVSSIFAGGQAKPAPQPNFSLALSAPQVTVKAGGPIIVNATVKNVSDHVIGVEENSWPETNYAVIVRNQASNEPPLTAFHRLLRGKPSSDDPVMVLNPSEILVPLDPGKTLTDSIDLTRLHTLGPGVYSVRIERVFDTPVPVRSNTLTITVIP